SAQPLVPPQNAGLGALPPPAQARISSTVGKDEPIYHAVAQSGGFRMENPDHHLTAEFAATGVEFRHGSDSLRMALRGYGYGESLRNADTVAPTAIANRAEYRRGSLTEWYVNGPLGLEQGFTFHEASGISAGRPL